MSRPSPFVTLLRSQKDTLIERWTRRVLEDPQVPHANRLPQPLLVDHIPKLVEQMIDAIERGAQHGEAVGRSIGRNQDAKEHAEHRFAERYSIAEALRELSHFRVTLIDLSYEHGVTLSREEADLVHAAVDESLITLAVEMEQAALAELHRDAGFPERFVGILGHDLRNPLGSITLTAAALLRREDVPEAQARALRRVAASAERMARMINDVLDLTRARLGGGLPIEPGPFNLEELCHQVVGELEVIHLGRTVDVQARGDLWGEWDADRVAQVLSNLIGNAIEHSPPETPVQVKAEGREDAVVLRVHNGGPPIPPEVLGTLFDPFRRGSASNANGSATRGLGLGLFIAQQIVEAHRGAIEVQSKAEEGTTFTVRLPRGR